MTEVVQAADYARVAGEAKKRSRSQKLHADFAQACRARRLPEPLTEHRFASHMKGIERLKPKKTDRAPAWRFDFCWPEYMLAVEIEGLDIQEATLKNGTTRWVCMGGHATPSGYQDDCEKYNAAALAGWTVLRFEQKLLQSGMAIDTTVRALHERGWRPGVKPEPLRAAYVKAVRESRKREDKPILDALLASKPKKSAPASKPRKSPPVARAASAGGVSLPVSGTTGPAPELSPAVQEIAENYPKGRYDLDLEWQRATIHIHALMKQGIELGEIQGAATLYRRQQQALKHLDTDRIMSPSEFFQGDTWRGPFPMPVIKSQDEIESEMSNEEWLRSAFARKK